MYVRVELITSRATVEVNARLSATAASALSALEQEFSLTPRGRFDAPVKRASTAGDR